MIADNSSFRPALSRSPPPPRPTIPGKPRRAAPIEQLNAADSRGDAAEFLPQYGPRSAPRLEAFQWTCSGLAIQFDFLDHRLRQRWLLPDGAKPPDAIPRGSVVSSPAAPIQPEPAAGVPHGGA